MVQIVVGGQSRNVGKTTVAAGLVASLPACAWTAVKITVCKTGECPVHGFGCDCPENEHPFSLLEERDASTGTDSSRFLAAGASRSFWARVKPAGFPEFMPRLQVLLANAEWAVLESNRVLKFLKPDLYILVVNPAVEDWKSSAREFLPKADAIVKVTKYSEIAGWKEKARDMPADIPCFAAEEASAALPALAEFVRDRLSRMKSGTADQFKPSNGIKLQ